MICERESIWNTEHIGLSYMYLHFHLHIMQIFVLQKHTAKHIIIMLVFGSVLLFWSSIHYYFCDFHVTLSYTVKMCSWFDIMLCHVNLNYCHMLQNTKRMYPDIFALHIWFHNIYYILYEQFCFFLCLLSVCAHCTI